MGEQAVMDRVVILYCLKLWPKWIWIIIWIIIWKWIMNNMCPVQNIRTPNKCDWIIHYQYWLQGNGNCKLYVSAVHHITFVKKTKQNGDHIPFRQTQNLSTVSPPFFVFWTPEINLCLLPLHGKSDTAMQQNTVSRTQGRLEKYSSGAELQLPAPGWGLSPLCHLLPPPVCAWKHFFVIANM